MPNGPNKRKSAKKKKKKAKPPNSTGSTPEHSPRDDQNSVTDSDGGQLSSPESNSQHNSPLPLVNAETKEGNSSAKKSTPERTEKASEQKNGKIEIDKSPKKKAVVIEPAPVNSSPKKGNNRKLQKNNDSPKTPSKQKVVDENASNQSRLKDSGLEELVEKLVSVDERASPKLKETGLDELVEKLVSVDERASPKSKDCLTASTLNCPFCGRGSADHRKEDETPDCSEKHPLLSSNPRTVEKTSWKSCCGIFEFCS